MIGDGYWTTGIVIKLNVVDPEDPHSEPRRWSVWLDFFDAGFCDRDSTEGTLRVRYLEEDLVRAIDVLRADAEQFGIEFRDPTVYAAGDEEHSHRDANRQAERLGWQPCYSEAVI